MGCFRRKKTDYIYLQSKKTNYEALAAALEKVMHVLLLNNK